MITHDDEGVVIDFRLQIPDAPRFGCKLTPEMVRKMNAEIDERRHKEACEDWLKWRETHKEE